jgi:hypothetical protein
MLEIVQNPDGSYSFGRYDRDEDTKKEIEDRIERAERMARYGANPQEIRQFWQTDLQHLYEDLDDPDRKVISKAFLEGIIDMTIEGQERIQKMNEIYKAEAAKRKPLPKAVDKKPSPVPKKMEKRGETIVTNSDEFKKALLQLGLSEAEASKEAALKKHTASFKSGATFKIYHVPGSGRPFIKEQIMK